VYIIPGYTVNHRIASQLLPLNWAGAPRVDNVTTPFYLLNPPSPTKGLRLSSLVCFSFPSALRFIMDQLQPFIAGVRPSRSGSCFELRASCFMLFCMEVPPFFGNLCSYITTLGCFLGCPASGVSHLSGAKISRYTFANPIQNQTRNPLRRWISLHLHSSIMVMT